MNTTHAIVLCFLLFRIHNLSYADDINIHKVIVPNNGDNNKSHHVIDVGLIVDMTSWMGKVVQSCISMAVSDFYIQNTARIFDQTRIDVHVRDSRGDSLHSIAAALDLLENVEVQAIIIPEISNAELFLARLCDKANIPLLSFSSMSSLNENPYFIQVAEDEANEFHAIAALLQAFKWRSFVFLYDDTTDGRQTQPYISNIFQEKKLDVAYKMAISPTATNDQIINELHKMMNASIILVHLSASSASRVFMNAKKLGMMSKGFAWFVTSKTMNFLDFMDHSVYDSMQGVVGLKSYFPASNKLQNVTLRWIREFHQTDSNVATKELNAMCVWAYDAAWLLADSVKRTDIKKITKNQVESGRSMQWDLTRLQVSRSGPTILEKMTSSKFMGLGGEFVLRNRKLVRGVYEILNVLGKGGRRVGFWTSANGLTNEPSINSSSSNSLETVIWPGFSLTTPENQLVQMSRRSFRLGIPARGRFPELVGLHHDRQSNLTTFRGFCVDVFHAAIGRLPYNFSFEYVIFDNKYGSYTELINEVYLQNYDAAVGDITILSNRSEYVDFTLPYTDLGVGFLVKYDDTDPWFFLKPLHTDLWIMCACLFVATGFVVWLFEHPVNEEFQGPPAQQIGTLLWFSILTLVYAQRERLQSNLSRFVVGIWIFVVFILASSYTANLSSLLTVQQIKKLTGSAYIGYSANSFVRGLAISNLNFTDNRFKRYQSPEEYDKALRLGSKKGGVDAILEEIPYLQVFLAKYPHDYTITHTSVTTGGFGFAFPKGSPLVHDVSKAILELREEGKLLEMEKRWFTNQPSPLLSQDTEPPQFNTLSIHSFSGLFLVSGISKAIALLIFFFYFVRDKLSIKYFISKMDNLFLISILRNLFFRRAVT